MIDLAAERDGLGPELADLGAADPGGPRGFDPSGLELRTGDALAILPTLEDGSVDLVATDPPYNLQLPMTMAGGALAEAHANRRTDYAMITDSADDLANAADYPAFLDRMGDAFRELHRVLREGRYAVVIVRDAYQDGRYLFTGSDLAERAHGSASCPKGDLIWYQAGTRLRPYGYPHTFVPNIVHQHILVLRKETGPASALAAARLQVGLEDVRVLVSLAHRPGLGGERHRGDRPVVGRRAARRPSRRGSCCGPSPGDHPGRGPASRRRTSRAAAPRRRGPGSRSRCPAARPACRACAPRGSG